MAVHHWMVPNRLAVLSGGGIRTRLLDKSTVINKTVRMENLIPPELSATARITTPFVACVAEVEALNFDVILG